MKWFLQAGLKLSTILCRTWTAQKQRVCVIVDHGGASHLFSKTGRLCKLEDLQKECDSPQDSPRPTAPSHSALP